MIGDSNHPPVSCCALHNTLPLVSPIVANGWGFQKPQLHVVVGVKAHLTSSREEHPSSNLRGSSPPLGALPLWLHARFPPVHLHKAPMLASPPNVTHLYLHDENKWFQYLVVQPKRGTHLSGWGENWRKWVKILENFCKQLLQSPLNTTLVLTFTLNTWIIH